MEDVGDAAATATATVEGVTYAGAVRDVMADRITATTAADQAAELHLSSRWLYHADQLDTPRIRRRMFKTIASHVPLPAELPSPLQWGDPAKAQERLDIGSSETCITARMIAFEFSFDPRRWWSFGGSTTGPQVVRSRPLLTTRPGQRARRPTLGVCGMARTLRETEPRVESEYLEVIATRS